MSDTPSPMFVSQDLLPERAAPVKTTGFIGFLRTRLFNSPTNILITIVSALLLWFTVIPSAKFLLIDAVWSGKDRNACLAENAGHVVGACWPYIQAKFTQFGGDVFDGARGLRRTAQARPDVIAKMRDLAVGVIALQRRFLELLQLNECLRRKI